MKRRLNSPLLLTLQLSGDEATKYVRAYLEDQDGTALAGSPVNMSNDGDGLYLNTSFLMPNVNQVHVSYRVFDDAGYTTRSVEYPDTVVEKYDFENNIGVFEDVAIETGVNLKQGLRLILSALAGKISGAETTTVTIRNVNDNKNRIVATVDSDGNRTTVSYDVTD